MTQREDEEGAPSRRAEVGADGSAHPADGPGTDHPIAHDDGPDDAPSPPEDASPDPEPHEAATARTRWLDAVVVVALTVVSAVLRWRSRPPDGLWFDDAWAAAGAKAPLDELFTVSTNHPGFTLGLMAVHRLVSQRADALTLPSFFFAVITPAVAYLVLRRLRLSLPASLLPATLLALSWPHAVYSGRVKPYVIEVPIIFGLALAVDRLDRRRWRWTTGAAWTTVTVLVSTLGAFAAVAAAAATAVLALGARADRRVRWTAAAVQAAVQGVLIAVTRRAYAASDVAQFWEDTYDSYIDLSSSPVETGRVVARHVARLGQAWVDSGRAVGLVVALVAIAGLVLGAVRGPRRPAARFLLLLVVGAAVGAVLRQVPFGPSVERGAFPGSRASLWLLPSLCLGTAIVLDAVQRRAARVAPWAATAVVAILVGASVLLVGTGLDDRPEHVALGTRTATDAIEAHRDDSTVVLVFKANDFSIATEPPIEMDVVADPGHFSGFRAIPRTGRRIIPSDEPIDRELVTDLVGDADRVIVHTSFNAFGVQGAWDAVTAQLEDLGFHRVESSTASFNAWERWERPG